MIERMKRVAIIGGGFGGLATACLLAKAGHNVTLLEKNEQLGGRAGIIEAEGFRFDMGPSWYLMPDVFERFFTALGEDIADYLSLTRLSPSYRIYYKGQDEHVDLTGDLDTDAALFERIEPGAGAQLRKYLKRSAFIYDKAVGTFLYRNYDHLGDFIRPELIMNGPRMHIFSSMDRYVRRYFKDERLQKIMEYPLVFLGSSPYNAPAMYSLMSHVDFTQGVFYPEGGMHRLVTVLEQLAQKYGATLRTNTPVDEIVVEEGRAAGVRHNGTTLPADVVISNADPYFTENALLPEQYRDHREAYWQSRTLAPSALLMYLGVNRQYDSLLHHTLLFSQDWKKNFGQIFDNQQFPTDPSLYICAPSKTDPHVAPAGHENLVVLVPLAPGLSYNQEQLEAFADAQLATLEQHMGLVDLRRHIVYKKLFCVEDFAERYNSYQGTGLGLAHTLRQTAIFRPANKSKKVRGLYYAGANVHPGIGVPTTLISAQLAAQRVADES